MVYKIKNPRKIPF